MSAATHGLSAGVVLGIVTVLLLQQFGYIVFVELIASVIDIVIGAIIGGVIFAVVGWGLGYPNRKKRSASAGVSEWKPT
jgi:hypothetical protein